MTLTNREALRLFMAQKDFTQARLARAAGVSRQFIWQLLNDDKKKTMKPRTAMLIAEALDVPYQVLFTPSVASGDDRSVKSEATRRAA